LTILNTGFTITQIVGISIIFMSNVITVLRMVKQIKQSLSGDVQKVDDLGRRKTLIKRKQTI
jgi:hypothetical protein